MSPHLERPAERPLSIYALTFCTAMLMVFGYALFSQLLLSIAVKLGRVSAELVLERPGYALELALGGPAMRLGFGILVSASVVGGVGYWASARAARGSSDPQAALRWSLRWRWVPVRKLLCASVGLIALTMSLDALIEVLGFADFGALASIRRALLSMSLTERAIFSLWIGIVPGVAEELFFRGYMMRQLENTQRFGLALLGSSIAFGAFHLDPVHSPLTVVMGLYLGYVVWLCDSLLVGIAAHTLNNMLAALVIDLPESANWIVLFGGAPISLLCLFILSRSSSRGPSQRRTFHDPDQRRPSLERAAAEDP